MRYDRNIQVRITDDFDDYLNQCAEFFGISKSVFIREQCFSNSFFKTIGSDNLEEDWKSSLLSVGSKLNYVAHQMNLIVKEFLESTKPNFILDKKVFEPLVDELLKPDDGWDRIMDLRIDRKFDYSYEEFHFDYVPDEDASETKNKLLHLLVDDDFYYCLKLLAKAFDKTISDYIIDRCSSVDYLQASSILENKDLSQMLYEPHNNTKQILRSIRTLENLCSRDYGVNIIQKNSSLSELKYTAKNIYEALVMNEDYTLEITKDWYSKASTRRLENDVKEIFKDEKDFLKYLKSKENRL